MSTLYVNNISSETGTTITIPTGKKLIGTDAGGFTAPGSVIQVVKYSHESENSYGSSTLSSSVYSVNITPKFATSSILITFSAPFRVNDAGQTDGAAVVHLYKDGSSLKAINKFYGYQMYGGHSQFSAQVFDTPATTSTINYRIYIANYNGQAASIILNDTQSYGIITAMEIAQ